MKKKNSILIIIIDMAYLVILFLSIFDILHISKELVTKFGLTLVLVQSSCKLFINRKQKDKQIDEPYDHNR